MRSRCLYTSNNSKNYKGRGISICDEWVNDYDKFFEDMGERPEGMTLERKEVNGNYEPNNCKWATVKEQNNNRRSSIRIKNNEDEYTISEWADILGLTAEEVSTVYKRHSKYNANTYEELFHKGNLQSYRIAKRENFCNECSRETSCKWRKDGTQCNTCYCRAYKKTKGNKND